MHSSARSTSRKPTSRERRRPSRGATVSIYENVRIADIGYDTGVPLTGVLTKTDLFTRIAEDPASIPPDAVDMTPVLPLLRFIPENAFEDDRDLLASLICSRRRAHQAMAHLERQESESLRDGLPIQTKSEAEVDFGMSRVK